MVYFALFFFNLIIGFLIIEYPHILEKTLEYEDILE